VCLQHLYVYTSGRIYLSVCHLSFYLYICLSIFCVYVCKSICHSVYLSFCLSPSVYLSICLSIYVSVNLPICLHEEISKSNKNYSICLAVNLSIFLLVYQFVCSLLAFCIFGIINQSIFFSFELFLLFIYLFIYVSSNYFKSSLVFHFYTCDCIKLV
jgi:hypothetical protein